MRPDGRSDFALRTLKMTSALLSRYDGSAKFDSGDSSVLCSVNGPTEVQRWLEQHDKLTIIPNFITLDGSSSPQNKFYEEFIFHTTETLIDLKSFPRTGLNISLKVLSDDGSILSLALNALVLALIDSGVPMKSSAAAITCMIHKNGKILLDPTASEIAQARSLHCFSFDCISKGLLNNYSTGIYSRDEYDACYDLAETACESIYKFFKTALAKQYPKGK